MNEAGLESVETPLTSLLRQLMCANIQRSLFHHKFANTLVAKESNMDPDMRRVILEVNPQFVLSSFLVVFSNKSFAIRSQTKTLLLIMNRYIFNAKSFIHKEENKVSLG